jgi:hypothetical protein
MTLLPHLNAYDSQREALFPKGSNNGIFGDF